MKKEVYNSMEKVIKKEHVYRKKGIQSPFIY